MSVLLKAGAMAGRADAALNIEDVFSTYVHTGTGVAKDIVTGIDLSTEGGMIWSKWRSGAIGTGSNYIFDTERGTDKRIQTDSTAAESTQSGLITAFNTDGHSLGSHSNVNIIQGRTM